MPKVSRYRDLLFAVLCLIGLITVFQYFTQNIGPVLVAMSSWWGKLLLFVLASVAAIILFSIRENDRFRYAQLELAFAFVSTWYSVAELTKEPSHWPVIVASMYLIVRGLDNLKEGHNRRMIAWRKEGMNGTQEERDKFLKGIFHGVRFNGRGAIFAARLMGKTRQEVFDKLSSAMPGFAAKQAKETDYDAEQTKLYVDAHRKAYESLAEEFGLS